MVALKNQTCDPGSRARRILVRGVNWLGDAVMTTPALQRLREHFPESNITLLTHEKLADLWLNYSCIDDLLTFHPGEAPWSIGRRLRNNSFDVALVFPNSPRSALEVWWAGIPERIGYQQTWRNVFLSRKLALKTKPMKKRRIAEIKTLIRAAHSDRGSKPGASPSGQLPHHIQLYLNVVGALGAKTDPVSPKLDLADHEVESASRRWLGNFSQDNKQAAVAKSPVWLGLNPSAAYGPAKCWPAENFAAVVQQISRNIPESKWLLFGGADDTKRCDQIAQQSKTNVINLAGKTSLRDLMALLKLCHVMLTNDSGPMHVAAALGTPVVVPFGSTSPELTGPGLPNDSRHVLLTANVPCSPCFRRTCPIDLRCMSGISVAGVSAGVMQLIQANPRS